MSDVLYDSRDMEGLPLEKQAKIAIAHILGRIHDHPGVGWYMGIGTQSFALLTEAFATMNGESVREVRERFVPANAADPASEKTDEEAVQSGQCLAQIADTLVPSDVIDFLELQSVPARMELLREIRERFCSRCGGDQGPARLPCQCRSGLTRKFRRLEIVA